ncbi:MAG: TonB family protein [Bdellovibrionia bacterium]
MNQIGLQGLKLEFEPAPKKTHLIWVLFLILALIFHALLFMIQFHWAAPLKPPPVDIQQIDPLKLESIRSKWKEKSLLLDRNPSIPSEKEAPPNARYLSKRNTQVEKEQRARETNVIPKKGKASEDSSASRSKPKPPSSKTLTDLGNLGVPFQLNRSQNSRELASRDTQNTSSQSQMASELGGDQALLDKDLPTGSENLLNTQESIFYSFYARLYEAIGPVWQSRIRRIPYRLELQPREYRTEVDVVLDQYGSVLEVKKLRSSGIEEFDRAIEDAWKKVGPFPNPPQALLNGNNQIHTGWTFSVNVQQGLGIQEAPPIRNY